MGRLSLRLYASRSSDKQGLASKMPEISVCIPVYNTESYLPQCLKSVAEQDFSFGIEILILSDASKGKDESGRSAKKIVKGFAKKFAKENSRSSKRIVFRYLENSQNLSLIESRRRLVSESRGEYIFMLDSDDFLPPNALSSLYEAALQNKADIVQGDCVTVDSEGKNRAESKNEFHPYDGILERYEIFKKCFCEGKYRPVIATKLIRREIYQKAFDEIPFIKAHMAEEVIQYFFVARFASRYVGIKIPVYFYRVGVGVTSRKITELSEWKKICSTASIFTALYSWIEEKTAESEKNPLDEEEMHALSRLAKIYCVNNVRQLKNSVAPELQEKALEMLCDFWGAEAIENTEEFLKKTSAERADS